MAGVKVEGLTKMYGATTALDDVTLTFPDGQFFGLLGPSGSGKTTLLRAIAGFVTVDRGRLSIGGQSVDAIPVEAREIGMVFQHYALFPNMTVAQNVAFGLLVRKTSSAETARRVSEVLELVQLGPLRDRMPHELSGGQKQRVALARAIVTRPRVLLLDEPLSALDKSLRIDMQIELKRIQREVGITTIFVTHDQEEALTLSDQIGILKDGKLVRHGAPRDVYENPGDVFAARFLGEANVFEVRPAGDRLILNDSALVDAPIGKPSSHIAIRGENVDVSMSEPPTPCRIQAVLHQRIYAGATITCVLHWNNQTIKAAGPAQKFANLPDTGPVWVSWPTDLAVWIS
jgi:putative spermidine/putrescine transport system ATP-binding protein